METFTKKSTAKKITYFAILVALTIVLQLVVGSIKIGPVTINFSLLPLVLCGMILGVWYGAALGLVLGVIILIQGILGIDPFTSIMLGESPVMITVICLVKTTVAGGVSALVFKTFEKNKLVGTFISAGLVPVINTAIFILGMLCISGSLIDAGFISDGSKAVYFLVVVCAGINFLIEFALNLIVAPGLYRVITVIEKNFSKEDGFEAEEKSLTSIQDQVVERVATDTEKTENNEAGE